MSDRLYLSCTLRGFGEANMLREFGKLLSVFPISKLAKRGPVIRVYAIEHTEPPLVECAFPVDVETTVVIKAAREFAHADCSVEIDTFWDLWQFDNEWKLAPAAVTLLCLGPEFENENDDNLRIEFGVESRFLPIEGVQGSLRMNQSNLRSLLHLVHDLERVLPLEQRRIWSESGVLIDRIETTPTEN